MPMKELAEKGPAASGSALANAKNITQGFLAPTKKKETENGQALPTPVSKYAGAVKKLAYRDKAMSKFSLGPCLRRLRLRDQGCVKPDNPKSGVEFGV